MNTGIPSIDALLEQMAPSVPAPELGAALQRPPNDLPLPIQQANAIPVEGPMGPSPSPLASPPMARRSSSFKETLGNTLGDFMYALSQGLSNRGKGGQSTGAGSALQAPAQLAMMRQQQAIAQQQQNAKAAMEAVKLRTEAAALKVAQDQAQERIANEAANYKSLAEDRNKPPLPPLDVEAVREYIFYRDQETKAARTPVSFNDYQNLKANRAVKSIDPNSPEGIAARKSLQVPATPPHITTDQGIMERNPVTGAYDIKRGNRPPSAALTILNQKPVGDFTVEGKDFLASIPAQWRKTVEKIANYDEDPTKVASMRTGQREQLMQWINQVNPGYDETEFKNIGPARKAFTLGTQGQQINAINTAIGHIGQIASLGAALDNSSFVPGNELYNRMKTAFGADKVTNFDTLKDALAGEISSVLSKGAGTVSGIAEAKEKIKSASSPKQLAGYVKTLIPVLGSKLKALDYEYQQATFGHHPSFSALSPEAKSVLVQNGVDPADPLGHGGTAPAAVPKSRTGPVELEFGPDGKLRVKP